MLLSRRFVAALLLFCCILALVDPLIFQRPVLLPFRILFWITNGVVLVAAWYLLFRSALWIVTRAGLDIAVPSAVLITLAVAAQLHVNYGIGMIVLDNADLWKGRLYSDMVRYTLVAILFETATAFFLVPGVLRALRLKRRGRAEVVLTAPPLEAPADPEPAPPAQVEINGETVDLSGLLYLKAAEHYVELVYDRASQLVRTSLRDVIERLHPDHGVQPHRSYWVNRDAIVGLNRRKGAQFLVLSNGDEIPVSRHRRADVGQWVQDSLLKKRPGAKPGQVQQGGAYQSPDMRGLD